MSDRLLDHIAGDSSCGNRHVSIRIGSPGNEAGVSQQVPVGACGGNANVSIRINSPGNDGPVAQSVGTPAAPGQPNLGFDPATLPAQLERSANRLAWSLVARAHAKAGLTKPAPSRARQTSRAEAQAEVHAAAGEAAARATAATTAASVAAAQRAESARRAARRAEVARPHDPLRATTPTSDPGVDVGEVRSAGSGGSERLTMLIALLAAIIAAYGYLLVPARDGASSRLPRRRGVR